MSQRANEIVDAGVVAGLVGGVAMALVAMAYAAAGGIGCWTPMKGVAAIVIGASAYDMGTIGVLLGAAVHAVTSITLGVLFAWLAPRDLSPMPALALGAFAGLAILFLMNLVVVPTYDWTAPSATPLGRPHLLGGTCPAGCRSRWLSWPTCFTARASRSRRPFGGDVVGRGVVRSMTCALAPTRAHDQ